MNGLNSKRLPGAGAGAGALRGAALVALITLGACGGGSLSSTPEESGPPTSLAPQTLSRDEGAGSAIAKVDEVELRKAIERYRITKQRGEGPYDFVGVDLTGDGRPEAVVIFGGEDWCQKTGCSLVVFQKEQLIYKPVSHVVSVRGPVLLGRESSFGWRDLIVKSGSSHTVRLVFTGRGYPGNAALQPEAPRDMIAQAQQILVGTSTASASTDGAEPVPSNAN